MPRGGSAARMEGSIDEVTLGVSCGRRREGGEGEPLSLSSDERGGGEAVNPGHEIPNNE